MSTFSTLFLVKTSQLELFHIILSFQETLTFINAIK